MLARRFLGCVFILTLLAVAGAFAIYQFGDRILIRMATPQGHFEAPTGAAPDYSAAEAWLARPGQGADLTDWRPANVAALDPAAPVAATFYVHPTTYLQNDRWNGPILADGEVEARSRLFVQSQASAFADLSAIWAPRYRQAAFGAFLLDSADSAKALNLAYQDVLRAFDAFAAANADKPLILAGHSQGSLHLIRLLRDRRDELNGRLVAAYIAGWPVDARADLPAMGLAACGNPDQVGCLLSWQSFADPANTVLIDRAWVGRPGLNGAPHAKDNMVCTNPLSGSGAAAPAAANLGTLVPDGGLSTATLQPGLVGARCHNGYLIIDGQPPELGRFVLPGNNYHVYDYALWWASIRADAARRLKAWAAR